MKKYVLISLLLLASFVYAETSDPANYYNDRLLICFQPDVIINDIDVRSGIPVTGIAGLDQLMALRDITSMEKFITPATEDDMDGDIILSHIFRLSLEPGKYDLKQLLSEFSSEKEILYAELEPIYNVYFSPNDQRFSEQWYMPKIQAPDAWDFWDIAGGEYPGSRQIVMASVDTGVQYTHADLWRRSWINQGEVRHYAGAGRNQ